MIVSVQTYNILLLAILILIAIRPLYTRFIKKQGNKHDWMFALLILLLPINWYTPTFINVTSCNNFTKEVLIFPGQKEGVNYSYGWSNYVVNNSPDNLVFEYIYYGDNKREDDEVDEIIPPGKIAKVNEVKIDFVFEPQAESVSTKSRGATKTSLYCK
ncbi:hypothetical protein LPB86_16960 [Pedobacter sp. MC2016-14]|uniref:hypothetical protein n=1 Tax=Pedobacter sp. MC2016-14 TaxID=2897327 RepID=UPI001E4C9FB4|nr:hypothetical protein [Pedobacter sp. MC2016-14]MCD0489935.1 hypothetical protein [Pedobacter sp. MC2016-14]